MTDVVLVAAGKQWRLIRRSDRPRPNMAKPPKAFWKAVRAKAFAELQPLPAPKFNGRVAKATIEQVIAIVGEKLGLLPGQVAARTQYARAIRCRQYVVMILTEVYGVSRSRIGRELGGRDHSTILNAVRMGRARRLTEPRYAEDYEEVKRAVLSRMEGTP